MKREKEKERERKIEIIKPITNPITNPTTKSSKKKIVIFLFYKKHECHWSRYQPNVKKFFVRV